MYVSVITPAYNEEKNVKILHEALVASLEKLGKEFEIIAVNDGSSDNTLQELEAVALEDNRFKIVDFRRNYGQTAAMMAGIDHAQGEIIVLIDADLQNDPDDIHKLLEKLEEGYDVVSGWRVDRKDAAIKRNFVSRMANRLISYFSGVKLHDYGCSLKAYRSEVVRGGWRLYGEMHRFIPIYASWMGARVTEIPVNHRARQFGESKYGLERIVKVLLDLMVIMFMDRFFVKPIYLFGGFGVLSFGLSFMSLIYSLYLKFFEGVSLILTPMPMFSAVIFVIGILSIFMGLLAEIMVRTYFESQNRPTYEVRKRTNFEAE